MNDNSYAEGILVGLILKRMEATISSLKAKGILTEGDLRRHELRGYKMQHVLRYCRESSGGLARERRDGSRK
jgi:hypothetical protein